jgi:AcrR family transcriptional regulator
VTYQETISLKPKKRIRHEAAVTRGVLLDATEQIMVTEGYAAVTTRRVASKVGLTAALVHYYYPTTEDLLVAAYRRAAGRQEIHIREALESPRPLHALWNLLTDTTHMALGVEFMALANHRKVIRIEIAQHDERIRRLEAEALANLLKEGGIGLRTCSPLSAAMLVNAVSRSIVQEEILGISCAHVETKALVERMLGQVEKARRGRSTVASQTGKGRRSAKKAA